LCEFMELCPKVCWFNSGKVFFFRYLYPTKHPRHVFCVKLTQTCCGCCCVCQVLLCTRLFGHRMQSELTCS
jgi:hypothetical protein